MAFAVSEIDDGQLAQLRATDESHFFELKGADSFDPVAKTLSAFGNADGGRLIVGVADPKDKSGRMAGYGNQEAANGHITEIMKMFSESPDSITVNYLKSSSIGGLLLDIEVEKSSAVISTPSNEIYLRRNAQNIRLRGTQQIQELAWKKAKTRLRMSRQRKLRPL